MAKSERRELLSRMSVLLGHLLKWKVSVGSAQQELGGDHTHAAQGRLVRITRDTPSLKVHFTHTEWIDLVWSKARNLAVEETGREFEVFPETCPWPMTTVLEEGFLPD